MKSLVTDTETSCPFKFNTDPVAFKVGDLVSYRVPDPCGEMPFVGELIEVQDDYVVLKHYEAPKGQGDHPMRGTREANPIVSEAEAMK